MLGVDPAVQHLGLGGLLVRHGLRRAAAWSFPTYLETASEGLAAALGESGLETVEQVEDDAFGVRACHLGDRHLSRTQVAPGPVP